MKLCYSATDMISQLTGKAIDITSQTLTIDVHGIGYHVHYPTRHQEFLIQNQSELTLKIHTHVREDQITLFGFIQNNDRAMFTQLITVSGIGPKLAMTIISQHDASQISHAIATANVEFFSGISGLGKKTAQKIIVELKNKVGSLAELDLQEHHLTTHQELIEALTALGYVQSEIVPLTKQISSDISLPTQLKQALSLLKK